MTDTPDISKEAVERDICTPIINYVADGRGMSENTLAGIIAKSRAMSARIAELEAEAATVREKALREAADTCSYVIKTYAVMKPDKETYEPMRVQEAAKGMVRLARQDIEALISKEPPHDT